MKVFFFLLFFSISAFSQTKLFLDFDQETDYSYLFDSTKWHLAKNISAYNVGSGCYATLDPYEEELKTKRFTASGLDDTLSFDYACHAYSPTDLELIVSATRRNWVTFLPLLSVKPDSIITITTTANNDFPLPSEWRRVKIKLDNSIDRVKFSFKGAYNARFYLDNIRIGSNTLNDAAIVQNLTTSGYTFRKANPGVQIRNHGLQQKDITIKFTIDKINYSVTENLSLSAEEVKEAYFDCSFLSVGNYNYKFELLSDDEDSFINNVRTGSFGVFNAEWKELSKVASYSFRGASLGLTLNDTNYVYWNGGGYSNYDTLFTRYNMNDHSITNLKKPPKVMHDHKFIYKDDHIYIPGGLHTEFYTNYSQDEVKNHQAQWIPILYKYSILNNTWDTVYNKLPRLTQYSPVIVRDSIMYLIGTDHYNDGNNLHLCYVYNFNTNTILKAMDLNENGRELFAFNDTLYLFYNSSISQGVIDPIDPTIISWSNYDVIPFHYSSAELWGDYKIIFTTATYWDYNNNIFHDYGRETIVYDIREKSYNNYLPRDVRNERITTASFINKDNKILFAFGNRYDFNAGPQILTEYLTGVVSVNDDKVETPASFELFQNYPNPFNAQTTISYNLNEEAFITLEIFNILGERLTTLVNQVQQRGSHKVSLNMNKYSSGVYIYRLNSNGKSFSKTMMMIK